MSHRSPPTTPSFPFQPLSPPRDPLFPHGSLVLLFPPRPPNLHFLPLDALYTPQKPHSHLPPPPDSTQPPLHPQTPFPPHRSPTNPFLPLFSSPCPPLESCRGIWRRPREVWGHPGGSGLIQKSLEMSKEDPGSPQVGPVGPWKGLAAPTMGPGALRSLWADLEMSQ